MQCKIKKEVCDLVFESFIKMTSRSVLLGSLRLRIKGDHAYRSGVNCKNSFVIIFMKIL